MNYQRIYNEIINNARFRGLNKKLLNYYTEKHHIIPKCLGGSNDKINLVLLTGREHYLCHWLLWKANKENKSLFYAYFSMIYIKHDLHNRNFKITSKQFHDIKSKNSNIMKNRIVSDETKKRISESRMGIVFSDDHKINIKNAAVERVPWNKNKIGIYSELTLEKMKSSKVNKKPWNFGKTHSDEAKKNISKSLKGLLINGDNPSAVKCKINDIIFDCKKNAIEYAKINLGMKRYQVLAAFNDDNNFEFEVIKCH